MFGTGRSSVSESQVILRISWYVLYVARGGFLGFRISLFGSGIWFFRILQFAGFRRYLSHSVIVLGIKRFVYKFCHWVAIFRRQLVAVRSSTCLQISST